MMEPLSSSSPSSRNQHHHHHHNMKSKNGSYNPMVIFGFGLLLAQFVIFNIGVAFFHHTDGSSNSHSSSATASWTAPTRSQQQQQQKKSLSRTKRKSKSSIVADPNADGTFNGYPVYLRQSTNPRTLPHCVGENYQEGNAWKHRSCKYEHFFCFDTSIQDFVVYQSPEEEAIYELIQAKPFIDVGQSYLQSSPTNNNSLSLGGINLKWGNEGIGRLEWSPKIQKWNTTTTATTATPLTYYELPSSVVMVPFHSMNGANPGHLVWDDFLPIFTLLTMFQLEEDSDLLMMRYVLKDGRGLWASCDWKDEKTETCEKMHKKFLPLMMGIDPATMPTLTTTENFHFQLKKEGEPAKSNLICAKNGVAGIGALTDHGPTKLHGWEDKDYKTTHNHGRGGMLYEFRNYMLSNIGVSTEYDHVPPFRIVFSLKSSDIPTRNIDFSKQMDILRKNFDPRYVTIESYVFKDIPLVEQVEIASQTTIYITGAGGGAVTATFLPRGASVFLYFLEDGGVEGGRGTGKPARLDWDLFNNMGYLKVHWLPKGSMNNEADLDSLVLLVQHELDSHMRERSYDKFFV